MKRLVKIARAAGLTKLADLLRSPWGSAAFIGVRHPLPWAHLAEPRIVTLNMGLGRDSLAMLCLLAEGKLVVEGHPLAAVDAVVFADTGAEWRHTTELIPRVQAFCDAHGIRFLVLRKPPAEGAGGFRPYLEGLPEVGDPARKAALAERPWRTVDAAPPASAIEERARTGYYHLRPPIVDDYRSRATIASRAKKDCTDNNKIEPIRKLINDLSLARFGLGNGEWGRDVKAGKRPPHLSLLGIAADEPTRAMIGHPAEGGEGPWYVTEGYPLMEAGITKAEEAAILDRHGFGDVRKSGCAMCPFQPIGWFWALRESEPERWAEVVAYENEALARNARMFLTRKMPINDAVDRWRAEHPDATVDAVLSKTYERDEGCQAAKHNPAARCPDCAAAFDAWETFAPVARRNPRPEFVVRSPAAGHRLIAGPVYTANWQAAQRVKPRERMAVLLPCAGTKPFSEAPSHKHGYLPALEGLAVDRYVVAEPLGIVPWDWEQKWPNDAYDFPPVYLRGEGRALLAERVRAWFETGPGRHYSRIYLALPGHHGRLVADATAGLTLPLVDLSITACRDAGDCGPGVHRATATDYRDYLHAAVARRNPAAQVALFARPKEELPFALADYDTIIVSFSGGKDSIACVIALLEALGPEHRGKVELWHQAVDGGPDEARVFDWPCTDDYCRAVARHFEVPIRFQYRIGGLHGELTRTAERPTNAVRFDRGDGTEGQVGGNGPKGITRRWPHTGAIEDGRWCSVYGKIMVAAAALSADPRFVGTAERPARVLFVTGERREESPNRAKYRAIEVHRCDTMRRRTGDEETGRKRRWRHVDQYRIVLEWEEKEVWAALQRWGIVPHPCYWLGFGRASCEICIFLRPNDWATLREIDPARFQLVTDLEAASGATINYDDGPVSVPEIADQGVPHATDSRWRKIALAPTFTIPVAVSPERWTLPPGAYRKTGGPV